MRGITVTAVLMAALAMAISATASAQEATSYQLLAKGRYAMAIDRLEQRHKASPDSPEATLNLATAYAHSGRTMEAQTLYREVLAEPAIDLDMLAGTTATSHQVARRGLVMTGLSIAAR